MKKCCLIGHRDILACQIENVKEELCNEILLAIKNGYSHFICGFEKGIDLIFADIINELKINNPDITLEAAIPYRKRLQTKNKMFQHLIKLCDKVTLTANIETYSKSCRMLQIMYMVNNSERIIAAYDGRETGGTEFAIRYAWIRKRDLHIIELEKIE